MGWEVTYTIRLLGYTTIILQISDTITQSIFVTCTLESIDVNSKVYTYQVPHLTT